MYRILAVVLVFLVSAQEAAMSQSAVDRVRARDIGVEVGIFQPGRWNAITDVAGGQVGHATVVEGICPASRRRSMSGTDSASSWE